MYMCSYFNISGAWWDEQSKTITLDPILYDRWDKVYNNMTSSLIYD